MFFTFFTEARKNQSSSTANPKSVEAPGKTQVRKDDSAFPLSNPEPKNRSVSLEPLRAESVPSGVDLLQFSPSPPHPPDQISIQKKFLNPYPDLLDMHDTNSVFYSADSVSNRAKQTQTTMPPNALILQPNPVYTGESVSEPPTPFCEFHPANPSVSATTPFQAPPLPKKKVRFNSSPSFVHRQSSLLDVDMGEKNDIHNPLMGYMPSRENNFQSTNEAPLLDLDF